MWLPAPGLCGLQDEAQCTSRVFSLTPHPVLFSWWGSFCTNNETLFSSRFSSQRPSCPRNLNYPVSCILPPNKNRSLLSSTPYPIETSLRHAASSSVYPRHCLVCLIPTLAQRPRGGDPLGLSCLCITSPTPAPSLQSLLRKDHRLPILHPCRLSAHPHTPAQDIVFLGRALHTGRQMHDSRQTLTLLAICILVHLPGQEALLVEWAPWGPGPAEGKGYSSCQPAEMAGLLGPGCVFFIPGHQKNRSGVA